MDESPSGITIFSASFTEGSTDSHALLLRAAQRYSGLSVEALGNLEMNSWGKPFFPLHPSLHFSITHSGDWWLCAFGGSSIGLDLQIHSSYMAPETLSRRFFHPLEDAFLASENYRKFFDLWCAKESWVKYTGRGFFDAPESFSVVSPAGEFPVANGAQISVLSFTEGYSLCLCTQTLPDVRFLRL